MNQSCLFLYGTTPTTFWAGRTIRPKTFPCLDASDPSKNKGLFPTDFESVGNKGLSSDGFRNPSEERPLFTTRGKKKPLFRRISEIRRKRGLCFPRIRKEAFAVLDGSSGREAIPISRLHLRAHKT
eukprot:scaffold15109_cov102-Cylindrotheca_fusiformis.AAC.1